MQLSRNWQEDDILFLIQNGIKESMELDYKRCAALQKTDRIKAQISKDISAFANSAGGTIVYGVIQNDLAPIDIDIGYDPSDGTKEWLEQVINSTIQPILEQVYVNQVKLTMTRPGKVLYVVETPQALTRAPHQASDHRYYKRFNLQTLPMQHYEIISFSYSTVQPISYYSCFISYSSKDDAFAKHLHADLQNIGIDCWFAPEDLKIGDKIRSSIDEAIQKYDKLLLVLSKHSIESDWVEKEVETAFEKESQRKKLVLFPVRLDSTVMQANQAWAADIRRTRHIGDFTRWEDHDDYKKALSRLLRDLQTEPSRRL